MRSNRHVIQSAAFTTGQGTGSCSEDSPLERLLELLGLVGLLDRQCGSSLAPLAIMNWDGWSSILNHSGILKYTGFITFDGFSAAALATRFTLERTVSQSVGRMNLRKLGISACSEAFAYVRCTCRTSCCAWEASTRSIISERCGKVGSSDSVLEALEAVLEADRAEQGRERLPLAFLRLLKTCSGIGCASGTFSRSVSWRKARRW